MANAGQAGLILSFFGTGSILLGYSQEEIRRRPDRLPKEFGSRTMKFAPRLFVMRTGRLTAAAGTGESKHIK
jgi:hypothetical protein